MARALPALPLLLLAAAIAVADSPKSETSPPMPVTRITVRAVEQPARALKYPLLPDPLDQVHGNAALYWLRAGENVAHNSRKVTPQEYDWGSNEVALKDVPRKEARQLLESYRTALGLAEQAARRDSCDWELPPLTFQNLDYIPLAEVQSLRGLCNLLSLQARLELAEGHLDKAVRAIQLGMAEARDIGRGPTLIHSLVGIAMSSIMLSRVYELQEAPDAPLLYWAVTDLPQPFVDVRVPLRYELNTVYRSFPQLRELEKGSLSDDQVRSLFNEMLSFCTKAAAQSKEEPDWLSKLTFAALVASEYPQARQYLLAHGWASKHVESMSHVQVVALSFMEQYNEQRDDIQKWFDLPAWQRRPGLERMEKRVKEDVARRKGNVIIGLLAPAIFKVGEAGTRLEHSLAGLRCAEAIRTYAAEHDGKLPRALRDITEVPLPIDPLTGKGFEDDYTLTGDKAVLVIAPPPGMPEQIGRRYEFAQTPGTR